MIPPGCVQCTIAHNLAKIAEIISIFSGQYLVGPDKNHAQQGKLSCPPPKKNIFVMLFQAVVKFFSRLVEIKILVIR